MNRLERERPAEPEFEILPPEGEAKEDLKIETLLKMVALIMDNLIRVPGTKFRIGLDPIIGLIPGLGDSSSAFVSAITIFQAARQGLPRIVLARMALNVLINTLGGALPFVGDVFSLWFKSNQRNYDLLLKHGPERRTESTKGDWIFVISLLTALAVAVLLIGVGAVFLLYQTVRLLGDLLG